MVASDTKSDMERPEMYMFCVDVKAGKSKPHLTKILINGNEINMEIDTGTTVTGISEITFSTLKNRPSLQNSNTQLDTYSGDNLNVLGSMVVEVVYKGRHYMLLVIVVAGKGPNLMGRNWLNIIKWDWSQMFYIGERKSETWRQEIEKYTDVFRD